MRFIIPTILLILSIALFVVYINPAYQNVKDLRAQVDQYNTALTNSRTLQEQRDALDARYRSLSADSLARLQKLLPDNVDNIRLIIDIQQMAQSYGMSLASIKFDSTQNTALASGDQLAAATPADIAQAAKDYGVFNLTFSTTATYDNFISFIKDVESSLRLCDIQSVDFVAADPGKGTTNYTVKLRTYWLKS